MKHLFSLASFAFLSFFLLSCENDLIESAELDNATATETLVNGCIQYKYYNKGYGTTIQYGNARGEKIIVGFAEGTTLSQQQRILGRYPQFKSISGEVTLDSGVLTIVDLYPGSTCSDVDKLLGKLLKEGAVQVAYPFFESSSTDPSEPWVGLSNEFMVSIEGSGTLQQLEKLVAKTRTRIVFSFSDDIHVLAADKNSAGHILDILTLFNQQSYITVAEPNLVVIMPFDVVEGQAAKIQSSQTLRNENYKVLKGKALLKR
jgi:hypothetical protein